MEPYGKILSQYSYYVCSSDINESSGYVGGRVGAWIYLGYSVPELPIDQRCPSAPWLDLLRPPPSLRFILKNLNFTTVTA
jgi:hypothetical protein